MHSSPYIITLALDEAAASFFTALRQTHFPPMLNYLSAHLTLFHHLPSAEEKVKADLQTWARQTKPFLLNVTSVVSIGKGVAYKIESAELTALHRQMQQAWQHWLTPQDRQKLWPHITVQNKVTPAVAKETLRQLQESFRPFTVPARGFSLWFYEGGPWRFEADYLFG